MLLLLNDRLRRIPGVELSMPRLDGIVRYHWVQTQMLQRDTIELLGEFRAAGLDTLLLKGAALNATIYEEGLRPMADIDLVVPRDQVDACLTLLDQLEWRPRFACHEVARQVIHATHLTGKNGRDVDLHWDIFHARYLTDSQIESIWNASHTIEVGGEPTRVLCPIDQLVHICEHGVRYETTPPFRWLADTYRIVQKYGDELDWERGAQMAKEYGLLLQVRHTLEYLERHLQLDLPQGWHVFRSVTPSLSHRAAYRIVTRRQPGVHSFVRSLPNNMLAYRRFRKASGKLGLGEFHCLMNDLVTSPAPYFRHFAKLSLVATGARLRQHVGEALDRWAGRCRKLISMATVEEERLEGVYDVESCDGELFRWTYPQVTIRVSIEPGEYTAELQLLPVRDWGQESMEFLFNRCKITIASATSKLIRFNVTPEMFIDHHEQRLVLRCSSLKTTGDPRQLGFPLRHIQFEKLESDSTTSVINRTSKAA